MYNIYGICYYIIIVIAIILASLAIERNDQRLAPDIDVCVRVCHKSNY